MVFKLTKLSPLTLVLLNVAVSSFVAFGMYFLLESDILRATDDRYTGAQARQDRGHDIQQTLDLHSDQERQIAELRDRINQLEAEYERSN